MSDAHVFLCEAETSAGRKVYATLIPPGVAASEGLRSVSIVGEVTPPASAEGEISPEAFSANLEFVDFLHAVIARRAPEEPAFQEEARRVGKGWVYVIDQRTPTPGDRVPPEDIIGFFEVDEGRVVPGSYRRSPKHQILSRDGFFRLEPGLHRLVVEEACAAER